MSEYEIYCPVCNSVLFPENNFDERFGRSWNQDFTCLKQNHCYQLTIGNNEWISEQNLRLKVDDKIFRIKHMMSQIKYNSYIFISGGKAHNTNKWFKYGYAKEFEFNLKYFLLPLNNSEENLINTIKKLVFIL